MLCVQANIHDTFWLLLAHEILLKPQTQCLRVEPLPHCFLDLAEVLLPDSQTDGFCEAYVSELTLGPMTSQAQATCLHSNCKKESAMSLWYLPWLFVSSGTFSDIRTTPHRFHTAEWPQWSIAHKSRYYHLNAGYGQISFLLNNWHKCDSCSCEILLYDRSCLHHWNGLILLLHKEIAPED